MSNSSAWPEPRFDPPRWIPWSEFAVDPPPSARFRGAYMVARFSEPTAHAPRADDVAIQYIGETHGRGSALATRLKQFGDSAGFNTDRYGVRRGRSSGHYAAWSYRFEEFDDPSTPVPYDDVYVALCPVPEDAEWVKEHVDAAGVLPCLFESMLIWTHVMGQGQLPPLNNSGRQHEVRETVEGSIARTAVAVDSSDILAFLAGGSAREPGIEAAKRILADVAAAWGYASRPAYVKGGDDDVYCARSFGRGRWLCLGWLRSSDAYLSLWRGETECLFEASTVSTVDEFRDGLADLLRSSPSRSK